MFFFVFFFLGGDGGLGSVVNIRFFVGRIHINKFSSCVDEAQVGKPKCILVDGYNILHVNSFQWT